MSSKIQETKPTSTLVFDRVEINKEIAENDIYIKDQTQIKNYVNPSTATKPVSPSKKGILETYLSNITAENTTYKGILNPKFQRESYGYNKYDNGDIYLGQYTEDKRNGHGIYMWNPKQGTKRLKTEIFIGNWKNDEKDGMGIYIWMDELKGSKKFDDSNFEAFVGNLRKNNFVYGTYLVKSEDNYYLYYGKIDQNGQKNDDKAYCYSSKMDRLMFGKIKDDVFESGYIASFNSETGEMDNINYVEFEGKDKISKIYGRAKIEQNTLKEQEDKLDLFRNTILDKDYFGILYNKFKDAITFLENGVKGFESFENKEKMNRIIAICDSFKIDNVYDDISDSL